MPSTKAQNEWNKINTVNITVKLNKHTDSDILERLEAIENRTGYIKNLIRKEMNEER